MNKKKILIVEDDDSLATDMQAKLMSGELEFKSVDNKEEAILMLKVFSPDVVLLDLGIYESSKKKSTAERINGADVAHEINILNRTRQGSNIQIILVTASLEQDYVKKLVDEGMSINNRIDKGSDNFCDNLKYAVASALEKPCLKEVVIPYKGISPELLEELKQCNRGLFELFQDYILSKFDSGDYFECIVRCGSFMRCLYDEFTLANQIEDLKKKFNNYQRDTKREDAISWNERWSALVSKGVVREIDKNFAVSAHLARNCPAHDGEGAKMPARYSIDDAATVLQLLVPLIRKYIECKKR